MTTLDEALKRIEDQFGKGSVMQGNEVVPCPTLSTGVGLLDRALGGGLAVGRQIEVFGPESAGKTTLIYSILSEAQKRGKCAFIDAEHSMDRSYAERCGVDVHGLLIAQPSNGEEALEIASQLVGSVELIAVDSVAALVPAAELAGDMGDQQVGLQPRLMGKAMRKLAGPCEETGTTIVWINQVRSSIGGPGGGKEVQPGGRALPFQASQRIRVAKRFKPAGDLVRGGEVYGHVVRADVRKNKIGIPFRTADFDIIYGQGIVKMNALIDLALSEGVVVQNGSYYVFGDIKGQGKEKFAANLREAEAQHELEKACQSSAN